MLLPSPTVAAGIRIVMLNFRSDVMTLFGAAH
jgi:hypothetical protein